MLFWWLIKGVSHAKGRCAQGPGSNDYLSRYDIQVNGEHAKLSPKSEIAFDVDTATIDVAAWIAWPEPARWRCRPSPNDEEIVLQVEDGDRISGCYHGPNYLKIRVLQPSKNELHAERSARVATFQILPTGSRFGHRDWIALATVLVVVDCIFLATVTPTLSAGWLAVQGPRFATIFDSINRAYTVWRRSKPAWRGDTGPTDVAS